MLEPDPLRAAGDADAVARAVDLAAIERHVAGVLVDQESRIPAVLDDDVPEPHVSGPDPDRDLVLGRERQRELIRDARARVVLRPRRIEMRRREPDVDSAAVVALVGRILGDPMDARPEVRPGDLAGGIVRQGATRVSGVGQRNPGAKERLVVCTQVFDL